MPEKTAEENLLLAAKAVELQIISAADCVNAIGKWNNDPSRTLLTFVEQQANLDDEKRRQLKELFEAFTDSMALEIADSIDDSVFDKLNDVLANVNSDQVQANVASLGTRVGSILQLVSEHRRFEIIAEHARGGLGEVLLAQDRQLNRKVALKRIREKWAQDNNARIRFQLEAEITGRLEHPGVVPVYALGQRPDGEIYYAMRFIRGDSLEAAVTEFHAAPDRRSTDLRSAGFRNLLRRFVDVCNTISYAHSRGIIHRDLKPANIMLGKYGETLVVDWGLAKQVGVEEVSPVNVVDNKESRIQPDSGSGSTPTQYGSAVGTPQYMSPEQATGRVDRMGPLTDVFGLGATLYHLLTNKPPQSNDSLEQILERVEHGDFAKPRDINPAVPRPLEAICLKALALRPSERYASATELGADIDRWLADEPVDVCRDSLIVRTTRWVRKNQTLAATTAVATLLLIVGGIVGNEIQHKREQREAEIELAAQSRVARLRDSLKATNDIVQRQIDNGQFATAVSVLHSEIETLKDEAGFESERLELEAKGNRLSNIDKSQQLALTAQKAN